MRARLLILTAGYGEGHNAAARALAAACDTAHGPGTARVVDLFALARPRFNQVTRRAYLGTINGAPRLWSRLYAWIDRSNIVPRCLWMLGRERRLLARIIAEEQPAVLCSTYPAYAFLLARLAADGHALPPHFNLVTDSISINSSGGAPAPTAGLCPTKTPPRSCAAAASRPGACTSPVSPSPRSSVKTPPASPRPISPFLKM